MPEKWIEFGKSYLMCFPIISMVTKRQVEEIGKVKWFLALFLPTLPFLCAVVFYGGTAVSDLKHIKKNQEIYIEKVDENTVTVQELKGKFETLYNQVDRFEKETAEDIVDVEDRLDKLEDE